MYAGQHALDSGPSQSRGPIQRNLGSAPSSSVAPLNFTKSPSSPRTPAFLEKHMNNSGLRSALAPLPTVPSVSGALSYIQQPSYDPSRKLIWCRDVLFLVDHHQQAVQPPDRGPGPARIDDQDLQQLVNIALPMLDQLSSPEQQRQNPMPRHVPEAVYLRATCEASGAYPQFIPQDPKLAFTHFEHAAKAGCHAAWFRLGRDYEIFGNAPHARECFENGAKQGVPSCLHRVGMAHLLGQLGLPASAEAALPHLHRAAKYATIDTPEPAYAFGMLLLGEFPDVRVPPGLFTPFLPARSSAPQEARRLLEHAAHLGYAPAQCELGHAFESGANPFPFDALLSVQYYWLASQQGNVEAHMALSKWFLCGSEGDFDKDEPLAQNAAGRGLPSAEFATGYYEEIGVGCAKNLEVARKWYTVAAQHGNEDARERLQALSQPQPASLSRQQHENITDAQLVRKRTLARERSRGTRYPPSAPATYNDPAEIRDTDAIRKDRSPGPRAAPGFPNAAPVRGYSPSQQRIPSVGVIPTGRAPPGMSGPATAQRDGRGRPPTDAPRYNPHTAQIPAQAPSGGPSRLEPLRRDNIPAAARPPLPKSGPQTFEEMGFRSQKLEDKECVIL